jgi:DNA/RNA endonuclease YhcR with UshA esterase domain
MRRCLHVSENNPTEKKKSQKDEKKLYYHGLTEQKKLDVSKLKLLSLIIAVLGVAVVLIAAQSAQAPLAKVSDVYGNYLMNYAVVRVKGNVTAVPYVSNSGGKLSITFTVNDGSGNIDVRVYSPVAERMIKEGKIPMPGDRVEAEIQLRVRETYTYGMLQYLEGLKFISKDYSDQPEKVESLSADMAYKYVETSGIVESPNEVSSGLLFDVDTGSGKVSVLIPKVLYALGNAPNITAGDQVTVAGIVYLYKGSSPEIVVRDLSAVKVSSPEQSGPVPLNELSKHVGETVTVQGTLETISYNAPSREYLVTISGDGTKVTAVSSRETLSAINPLTAGSGSTVRAIGMVTDNGTLKVSRFDVITPVAPKIVKVSSLGEDDVGRIAVVEGNIVDTAQIGSNLKLTVSDRTGEIAVFIPAPALGELDETTKANLKKGLGVRIGGYVENYKGTLEIVPYTGKAILAYGEPVKTETSTSTGGQNNTGTETVSLAELGSATGTVELNVTWEDLYYSKPNYILLLKDSSGEANLTVPRSLIPNPLQAGTGSSLLIKYDADGKKVTAITVLNALPSPTVKTGDVTLDMKGKTVIVEGTVKRVYAGSTFFSITLNDGSGDLAIFIPKSVAGDASFKEGEKLKVGGYVTEYKGKPEVVPYNADAIAVEG